MRNHLLRLIADGYRYREGCIESLAISMAINDLSNYDRENVCPVCKMGDRAHDVRRLAPDPATLPREDH